MEELTTLSKEACELLKVRAHTLQNDDGTETERVLLLFPFDEDNIEAIKERDGGNVDDQETVASLDSIGRDQGYGDANIKLFEGMVEIEAHLVEPKLSLSSRSGGKGGMSMRSPSPSKKSTSSPLSSPNATPGRLSMRKRMSQTTAASSGGGKGDKIIGNVKVNMTVNAIEQNMGLDRELAVCVEGVFNYDTLSSDTGVTFTIDLEDDLGMPSMCLIDPDSAKEFAEGLHDKLFIEFTKNGMAVPCLKAKPTATYY